MKEEEFCFVVVFFYIAHSHILLECTVKCTDLFVIKTQSSHWNGVKKENDEIYWNNNKYN